jgi:hypothetical protein
MPRYSWTQAICQKDWEKRYPGIAPTVLVDPIGEICAYCGEVTKDGIYIRDDPANVKFPREKED